jgi:hypothetical protein
VSGSSVPPPPPGASAGVAAWYASQQLRARHADLERKVEHLETALLRELGDVKSVLRELKLRTRQSGHQLEELKEWQEDSKVRELKLQLAEKDTELAKRVATKAVWMKRIWTLVSALILLIAGAILREFTRAH